MALHLGSATTFLREVRQELKSVQWPSRAATTRFTVLIAVVTIAVAIVTGALDFLLTTLVERLLLEP